MFTPVPLAAGHRFTITLQGTFEYRHWGWHSADACYYAPLQNFDQRYKKFSLEGRRVDPYEEDRHLHAYKFDYSGTGPKLCLLLNPPEKDLAPTRGTLALAIAPLSAQEQAAREQAAEQEAEARRRAEEEALRKQETEARQQAQEKRRQEANQRRQQQRSRRQEQRRLEESLQCLDSLRDSRRDELMASSLARLESFVLDPAIRQILTQQAHSLDLGQVMGNCGILVVNLEEYRPLRPDDVRLLGRLLINDIIAHVFNRPPGARAPVYLILDECHTFATPDLCRALDKGRELGLHCVLAHQYLEQLKQEEKSGLLYHSAMECARSKVIFGGVSTQELELLTAEVMIDRYDPWRVKDEITTLECEPVESKRKSLSYGESTEQSRGLSHGRSYGRTRSRLKSRSGPRTSSDFCQQKRKLLK